MCIHTIGIEAYIGIAQTYTAIKMTSFMGSPWLLDLDNIRYHSACATTVVSYTQSESTRLACLQFRSVSY